MAAAGEQKEESTTRLHVSNLSWDTTTDGLKAFFEKYGGVVSAEAMFHDDTGRSKGWGLVEFSDSATAQAVMDAKDSGPMELDGRAVRLKFDGGRPVRAPRPARAKGGKKEPYVDDRVENSSGLVVYVGNLPWTTTTEDLQGIYGQYNCTNAEVQAGFNGRSRGYGLVTFSSIDLANAAIDATNGSELQGRQIQVRLDKFA